MNEAVPGEHKLVVCAPASAATRLVRRPSCRMGPQVMLRAGVITPSKPMRYEFMAFGGSFIDAALRKDIAKCGERRAGLGLGQRSFYNAAARSGCCSLGREAAVCM